MLAEDEGMDGKTRVGLAMLAEIQSILCPIIP
jgi:hypothetical protein